MTWVWAVCVVLLLLGLAGVFVPLLPGTSLILAAAILHKLMLPAYLSRWTVAAMALLALADALVGLAGSAVGARWAGATRWGIAGAGVGAVVGLFFGLPGLLVGPLAGAALAEVGFARRSLAEASKAAVGAGLGLAASGVARVMIGFGMVVWLLVDCFVL